MTNMEGKTLKKPMGFPSKGYGDYGGQMNQFGGWLGLWVTDHFIQSVTASPLVTCHRVSEFPISSVVDSWWSRATPESDFRQGTANFSNLVIFSAGWVRHLKRHRTGVGIWKAGEVTAGEFNEMGQMATIGRAQPDMSQLSRLPTDALSEIKYHQNPESPTHRGV